MDPLILRFAHSFAGTADVVLEWLEGRWKAKVYGRLNFPAGQVPDDLGRAVTEHLVNQIKEGPEPLVLSPEGRRIERQQKVIPLRKKGCDIPAIAAALNVSEKTIDRDLDALREAGKL
jgi:hypothetical protein